MATSTSAQKTQAELDALARRMGWARGPFRSWIANGFTISVGRNGYPRRNVLASGRSERREFASLEELADFIRGWGWPTPRGPA